MKLTEAETEKILKDYKDLVRSRARLYFILGGDFDDLVQEGMIGLFKAIGDYDSEKDCSFKSFAELCINRQILTAIKAAGRKKHSPLNTAVSLEAPVSDANRLTLGETLVSLSDSNPENIIVTEDSFRQLLSEDSKILSPMERRVFELMIQGLNYMQISVLLKKPPKSIDNAIQRIRKKIRSF